MYKSHMLFFLYGASGSGKSALLNMLKKLSNRISVHRKDTTRKPRPLEKGKKLNEVRFRQKFNEKNYVLTFEQWGNQYGIRRDLLVKAFENQELHFIIIGNMETLKKMKALYPYAKSIYIHCSPIEIPKRFLERDTIEYEQRKNKIAKQYKDFLKNNTFFDHIIINFWDIKNACVQIRNILKLYDKEFEFDRVNKC